MSRPTIKTGAKIDHETLGRCEVIRVRSFGDCDLMQVSTGNCYRVQGMFAKYVID